MGDTIGSWREGTESVGNMLHERADMTKDFLSFLV